jgi:hypothetical protein
LEGGVEWVNGPASRSFDSRWVLKVLKEKSAMDDGIGTEELKEIVLCISQTVVAFFVIWIATQVGDDRDFILVLYSGLLYGTVLVLQVYLSKVYASASQPSDLTQR